MSRFDDRIYARREERYAQIGSDPWLALCNAVITQACNDYRCALCHLHNDSSPTRYWEKIRCDCERFFKEEYFDLYSSLYPRITGDTLMKDCQKDVEKSGYKYYKLHLDKWDYRIA